MQTQAQIQIPSFTHPSMQSNATVFSRVRASQFPLTAQLLFRILCGTRNDFPAEELAQTQISTAEVIMEHLDVRDVLKLEAWLYLNPGNTNVAYDYVERFYLFSYEGGIVPVNRELIDPEARPALNRMLHLKVQL